MGFLIAQKNLPSAAYIRCKRRKTSSPTRYHSYFMNKIHTLTDTGLLLISSPDNGGIRLCLLSEKSPISWFQTEAPRRVLQFPSTVSHRPTALCASVPCILFLIKAFFIIHLCLLPYHFQHLLSIQNFSVKVIVNHGRNFPDSICSIILSGCRKNNDHIIGFLSVNNCCIMLISEVIKKELRANAPNPWFYCI